MLKIPTIVLNVKTYAEATSDKALEIALLMDKISKEYSTPCIPATYDCLEDREELRFLFLEKFSEYVEVIDPASEDFTEFFAYSDRMESSYLRHREAVESLHEH